MQQSIPYARKAHILTLLKSGKPVSLEAILKSLAMLTLPDGTKLECVSKTVIRDIKELQAMGCPVKWRRAVDGYELQDLTWDMPATPLLGSSENLAIAVGAQFGAACLPKEIARQIKTAGAAIFNANTSQFYSGADLSALKILVSPLAPQAERVFAMVYEAWSTRHLLTITYADEKGETTTRTIEPQALMFHEMSWFVRSYCYLRSDTRTFAVSRIEKAKIEDGTFAPRPELYENATFDNFDERDGYKDIEIRLTKVGRQFAVAHVLHSQQKITANEDGSYTMSVPVKAKHLAVQWLMSQCGEAVPVAPAELIDAVIARSKAVTEASQKQKEEEHR